MPQSTRWCTLQTAFVYAKEARATGQLPHDQPGWAHAEDVGGEWTYHRSPHTIVTAVEPSSSAQDLRAGCCVRYRREDGDDYGGGGCGGVGDLCC